MVDVVCDPNVLEVRPVLLSSLAEVDVQVVKGDWWMGPGQREVSFSSSRSMCMIFTVCTIQFHQPTCFSSVNVCTCQHRGPKLHFSSSSVCAT